MTLPLERRMQPPSPPAAREAIHCSTDRSGIEFMLLLIGSISALIFQSTISVVALARLPESEGLGDRRRLGTTSIRALRILLTTR